MTRAGRRTRNVFEFKFEHPSFPGSIAVVKGDPVKVPSEASPLRLLPRAGSGHGASVRRSDRKAMSYFTGMFACRPYANLTWWKTEEARPTAMRTPRF